VARILLVVGGDEGGEETMSGKVQPSDWQESAEEL
jgi:hypothetical protein